MLQRGQIAVGPQHRVLNQGTDDYQMVRLAQSHALPGDSPDHQDQLHFVLLENGVGHQGIAVIQLAVDVDLSGNQGVVKLPQLSIPDGVAQHLRLLRGGGKQAGVRGVGDGVDVDSACRFRR